MITTIVAFFVVLSRNGVLGAIKWGFAAPKMVSQDIQRIDEAGGAQAFVGLSASNPDEETFLGGLWSSFSNGYKQAKLDAEAEVAERAAKLAKK